MPNPKASQSGARQNLPTEDQGAVAPHVEVQPRPSELEEGFRVPDGLETRWTAGFEHREDDPADRRRSRPLAS